MLCKVLLGFVYRKIQAGRDLGRPWPQPLPGAGSAVGSDQAAQGFTQQRCEIPRDGDSPTSLGPSPTAGLSSWGKGFSLSQA